jgi:hypothetical protein
MATQLTVQLTYDPELQTLTADTQTLALENPDDWVLWKFVPTSPPPPEGSTLFVHFAQPLGPFQAIRNVTRTAVIAKGNTGALLTFPYFLFLLLADGTIHQTQPLSLVNQSATVNTSPMATVTFVPNSHPDPDNVLRGHLVVQPPSILLHERDIAQWQVVGPLPDNYLMAFNFAPENTSLPGHEDDPVGPFAEFFLKPGGAGSPRAGAGIFISDQIGLIPYHIDVWNADGILVASHDPSIDGLGKPPVT